MKNLLFYFLAPVLVMTFSSCQDDVNQNTEPDYIIVGHFYGMCQGEQCVEIFKITDKELFEDSKDIYPARDVFANTDFSALSDDQFQKATSIISNFPKEILNDDEPVMGCPDCHDQGGLYIEYKKGNSRKFWLLDNDKPHVDEYLHEYIDEVRRVIEEINR